MPTRLTVRIVNAGLPPEVVGLVAVCGSCDAGGAWTATDRYRARTDEQNGSARGRQGLWVESARRLVGGGSGKRERAYDGLGCLGRSENGSPGTTEASAARIVSAGMPATSGWPSSQRKQCSISSLSSGSKLR